MGADYHIYLHSVGGGSNGNGGSVSRIQPFSSENNEDVGSAFKPIKQGFSAIASGNAINTGVAALTKVVPTIATFVALTKIADKVLTTGFSHQTEYTGNYDNEVAYNNFKTSFYNAVHPIRFWLSIKHQDAQFRKQNKAIAEQNRLIGNSILKDFNIGV